MTPPETAAAKTLEKPASQVQMPEKAKKQALETLVRERVEVLGSPENARKTPGSAFYITKEDLKKQEYDDVHRILQQIPGINIQEEEGLGLRPNIGIRGTGVERSQKITLMEDGVLIAPAPYTAPSAYYFPTAGRMQGFEVLKGPSSVKQGPYTNGGSLNMISSAIPSEFHANLSAAVGEHDTTRFKARLGNAKEQFGWLVETYQLGTGGFKELDGGGDTGVDLEDYLAKIRFNSKATADIYHSLELKLGKTEQLGHETYLGLTQADFDSHPYRRYLASGNDFIDTDHKQFQLRYFVKPSAALDVTTTIYFNDFFRNWHKLESVRGVSNRNVLASPERYPQELAILRGEIDSDSGELTIRNNRRNYESKGIQSVLHFEAKNHELEIGVRYHEDEEDRLQNDEQFQILNGALTFNSAGDPGSQTNRFSYAESLSFFIEDTISLGAWTLTPGIRFEKIDYTREDYAKTDPARLAGPSRVRQNGVQALLPGIGVDYRLNDENRVFVGAYKGFSPPGAGRADETQEEESLNFEFGYRHTGSRLRTELIGFYNDYNNLLGTETVSGGGSGAGDVFNGGEVEVKGLEAVFAYDFFPPSAAVSFPFAATYTYTTSEFKSSFETGFSDWSPRVSVGDRLPYIPENQLNINLSAMAETWGVHLNSSYVEKMRSKAGSGPIPENEVIESHFTLDLTIETTIFRKYRLFAQVRNLGNEEYLVARRPYGVRPGLRQQFLFGASAKF